MLGCGDCAKIALGLFYCSRHRYTPSGSDISLNVLRILQYRYLIESRRPFMGSRFALLAAEKKIGERWLVY